MILSTYQFLGNIAFIFGKKHLIIGVAKRDEGV